MVTSLISLTMAAALAAIITSSSLFASVYAQTSTQQLQQQPTSDGVSILSSSQFGSDFGSTYIVGEVRNNLADAVINYVQVVGKFYDASGVLIDTDYTYTDLDYLRPGEKSPFKLIITDESVAQRVNNYTLDVNWERTGMASSTVDEATVLTLEQGEQRVNDFGRYEVVGEVVNHGTENTEFVKVVATFYDETGKVIDSEYTYTEPTDLMAGQSGPFEISVLDERISDDIESVKLTAQSNSYFAIDPELAGASPPSTTAPQIIEPLPSPPQPTPQQPPPSASKPQLVL